MDSTNDVIPEGYYSREMLEYMDLNRRMGGGFIRGQLEAQAEALAHGFANGFEYLTSEDRHTPIEKATLTMDAVNGGAESGKRLLEEFCFYVDRGWPPPPWMLTTLSDLFKDVMNGGSWEVAFPLPGRAKQLATKVDIQQRDIAIRMAKALSDNPELKVDAAKKIVANELNVSVKTVEGAWYGPHGKILKNDPKNRSKI
jgi:hypothetical protein